MTKKPQTPNYRLQGPAWEAMLVELFRVAMPGAHIVKGKQAKEGGAAQADVVMPVLHVEAKWKRKENPRETLAQAVADADPDALPIGIILDDPDEGVAPQPFCVVRLSDLLTLMHSLWSLMGPVRGARWRASDWRPPPIDIERLRKDLRRRQGVASDEDEGEAGEGEA